MLPTDLLEKAMRPAFLGIIGCGAMGRLIARHIREQLPSYRLGGLFSRTTAHAEGLALDTVARLREFGIAGDCAATPDMSCLLYTSDAADD